MDAGDGAELVGVAYANDLAEGEMIKGLLESSGIPSVLQRVGIDGPSLGFGLLSPGGGSQQVMVHAHRAEEARALLATTLSESEQVDLTEISDLPYPGEPKRRKPRRYGLVGGYARIWAWSFGTMGLAFAVFLLLRSV